VRAVLFIAAAIAAFTLTSPAKANDTNLWCKEFAPSAAYANLPQFTDTFVKVEEGRKVPPQLHKGTWQREMRDKIRAATECPISFGGHYRIAFWGVGTEAKEGAMVDGRTGVIYSLPSASWEYVYRADSRTLVVDPVVPETSDPATTSRLRVYEWLEEEKRFQERTTVVDVTLVTNSVQMDSTWKAIAYNQEGASYVSFWQESEADALVAARGHCDSLYGDCVPGVAVPMDWVIAIQRCGRRSAQYVTIGFPLREGEDGFVVDSKFDEIPTHDRIICEQTFRF